MLLQSLNVTSSELVNGATMECENPSTMKVHQSTKNFNFVVSFGKNKVSGQFVADKAQGLQHCVNERHAQRVGLYSHNDSTGGPHEVHNFE